jgi:hypothetical protein
MHRSGHLISVMASQHISDDDLERYYLGMITQDEELALLEEHIIGCQFCATRAEEAQDYVDAIRAALIKGNYDVGCYEVVLPPPAPRADRRIRRSR